MISLLVDDDDDYGWVNEEWVYDDKEALNSHMSNGSM